MSLQHRHKELVQSRHLTITRCHNSLETLGSQLPCNLIANTLVCCTHALLAVSLTAAIWLDGHTEDFSIMKYESVRYSLPPVTTAVVFSSHHFSDAGMLLNARALDCGQKKLKKAKQIALLR